MKELGLNREIHKAFESFQTPTYNFKHLRNLELKVDKEIKKFIRKLKRIGKERLKHLSKDNYELFCEDVDTLVKGDRVRRWKW